MILEFPTNVEVGLKNGDIITINNYVYLVFKREFHSETVRLKSLDFFDGSFEGTYDNINEFWETIKNENVKKYSADVWKLKMVRI